MTKIDSKAIINATKALDNSNIARNSTEYAILKRGLDSLLELAVIRSSLTDTVTASSKLLDRITNLQHCQEA